jgi:hypothetical protein
MQTVKQNDKEIKNNLKYTISKVTVTTEISNVVYATS